MNESHEKTKYDPINDVDDCAKKWEPLTQGLDDEAVGLCAWTMEREAKFLQRQSDHPMRPALGSELKYIFPVIRKAVATFVNAGKPSADGTREELAESYQGFVNTACAEVEIAHAKDRCVEPQIDLVQKHELFVSLGERLADYTLCYPRLN